MTAFLLRPVRLLAQALTSSDSPRQIAWAVVIGMFLGLVPKGNLIAVALGVALCGLKVNLAAGMMAAMLFSVAGIALDPLAHRLGSTVLLWDAVRPAFRWLYEKPLGPWIGFNNTVVLGQLIVGLYLIYPVYRAGHVLGAKVQPRVRRWLMGYRVIRWLRGAEIGATWGA